MKKIIILGGSASQVSAIKMAKKLGYYTITCDYLPNNPGHQYADKYYNISTVSHKEILEIAKKEKIDAISSYASEPGAFTAAYVSEMMGIKGSGLKAIDILSNKNKFRSFLKANHFNTPFFKSGTSVLEFKDISIFPGILKPVDSSGSKGIVVVNSLEELKANFDYTKGFSRTGYVIFEEFIGRDGPQIHGEVFVIDGKISVFELGDQYFSPINPLVPYSTILPTAYHQKVLVNLKKELQKIIDLLDYQTGGMNVEAIKDKNGNIYFIEIGSRSGGNFMPELVQFATGIDLIELNLKSLIDTYNINITKKKTQATAQIIFHAFENGKFSHLNLPKDLIDLELFRRIYKTKNVVVKKYENSSNVVGVGIYDIDSLSRSYFENILGTHNFSKLC
jgi:biotin carboxylase